MKKFAWILPVLLLLLVMLVPADLVAQCPMCKAAVESGTEEGTSPLARGLNNGILYLFILPFLTIGTVTTIWVRRYLQKQKTENQ